MIVMLDPQKLKKAMQSKELSVVYKQLFVLSVLCCGYIFSCAPCGSSSVVLPSVLN